jgi:hypothetical protein
MIGISVPAEASGAMVTFVARNSTLATATRVGRYGR